jgi:hypothetical protein
LPWKQINLLDRENIQIEYKEQQRPLHEIRTLNSKHVQNILDAVHSYPSLEGILQILLKLSCMTTLKRSDIYKFFNLANHMNNIFSYNNINFTVSAVNAVITKDEIRSFGSEESRT